MTRFADALDAMRKAGKIMLTERPGFVFGEWAGESTSEIILEVTGQNSGSFNHTELDALLDAYEGL